MTKAQLFIIIAISSIVSLIVSCVFNPSRNKQDRYEQLTKLCSDTLSESDTLNISKDPSNSTIKDLQEHFKPPKFKNWFTNDTFYLRDLEIGKIKWGFFEDQLVPTIKTDVISISNKSTIVAYDLKNSNLNNTSNNFFGDYLEFTYRGLRYQVCNIDRKCYIQIFGRTMPLNSKRCVFLTSIQESAVREYNAFWWRNKMSRNVYIRKWVLGNDEWLTVYRDDENKVILEFHHD